MRSSAVAVEIVRLWAPDNLRRVAPVVALCAVIAAIAFVADKQDFLRFGAVWIPPLILTLVIGMALQPLSDRAVLKPGIEFAGRTLLRVGVAAFILYEAYQRLAELERVGVERLMLQYLPHRDLDGVDYIAELAEEAG